MREILYIQAGSLANHVGTHFWNTQASYFTYESSEEVLIGHDISFREGLDHDVGFPPVFPGRLYLPHLYSGKSNLLSASSQL